MGSKQGKGNPKRRSKPSKLCITFLSVFILGVAPARGFFLKSCRISGDVAICVNKQLATIPRDILPTVRGVDLSQNQLSRIQPSDFISLPVLIQLDLNRNHISQIDSFAFKTLISLQKLNLNNNKLVKLEENVFEGLGNLTELRVNNNHIKVLSSTSFQSLTRLKLLDISKNKLEKTADFRLILQHLPQLQELVLKGNKFKSFHSWEFTNRSLELRALDLSLNPLKDFRMNANVFPHLTRFNIAGSPHKTWMKWEVRNKTFLSRVSRLDISGLYLALDDMRALLESMNSSLTSLKGNQVKENLLSLVNISCTIQTMSALQVQRVQLKSVSSDLFKLCVNVTELDLSKNSIDTIQENAFAALVDLRILTLSYNEFTSVPSATRNLQSLSELDLSFNKIRVVECQDLANQTKLRELSLQHNSISALKNCLFKDLVQLQVLRLQYNQITRLNGAFQRHLPNLQRLHLNGNKLTAIKKHEFDDLRSLLNLSLHENKLNTLDKRCFVGLMNLTDIQLQSNNMKQQTLDTGALNALINLRRLNLEKNHISYNQNTPLSQTPFSDLSNLEELSINAQHHRGKSHLPQNFLKGLKNLLSFSARNIQLIHLDKDMFKYTPKLKRLDISSNDLGALSAQLFSPIHNLKGLYISSLSLRSLDFLKNSNLTRLDFLQARKNQYSVITEEVIRSLPSLVYLDFLYNSFSCDCDNVWFLNWTIKNTKTQVSDADQFKCNYPVDFEEKKLLDFDPTSCSVKTGFVCFVLTTCVILCFMVASFTYHFMRWQLYCAYYLYLAWLYDKKHENNQTHHQYDAFISYNAHDEPWVVGELLPKLEGEQGWRLCLHHRDFVPGKPILSNITDSIYGSRKTICVISRRYLESEWCSREVQTASFRLFDEKKDVLILVFLEDIPTYLLSPFYRMRKLLKKQTYLSWSQAAEHPEVFWEKLRRALHPGEDLNEENFKLSVLQTQ